MRLAVVTALIVASLGAPQAAPAAQAATVQGGDWAAPAADQSGSAASTDTSLTASSLLPMGRVWSTQAIGAEPFLVAGGRLVMPGPNGIQALDPATGHVIWRHDEERAATLVASGTRVFAMDTQGTGGNPTGLVALDLATGKQLWYQRDPDPNVRALYGTAVVGNRVFAMDDQGTLRSYDAATGAPGWTQTGYAGGLHAANGWLFSTRDHVPTAVDAATGKTVWTGDSWTYATPGVIGGRIVVGRDDQSMDVWPLAPCDTRCAPALHLSGNNTAVTGTGDVLVRGVGIVAGSADPAKVQAVDARTGSVLWTGEASGAPRVSLANGVVYAVDGASDGLVEIRAWRLSGCGAPTCPPVWRFRFPSPTDSDAASLVVPAHGHLYVNLAGAGLQALGAPGAPYSLLSSTERSGVAVVARGDRTDLFLVGLDRRLHHRYRTGGTWSRWEALGGSGLTGTPAAASWRTGRYDVVVRDEGGHLLHTWYAGGWSGYQRLADGVTGDPAMTSPASGALDLAWPTGSSVTTLGFRGRWAAPARVGSDNGVVGVSVVSMRPGRLDVFGIDAYYQWVVQATRVNGSWHRFAKTGMSYLDEPSDNRSATGAASWAPGRIDLVFNSGFRGPLAHVWFDGSWHAKDTHAVYPFAGPSLAAPATRRLESFSVDGHLAIEELAYTGSSWVRADG